MDGISELAKLLKEMAKKGQQFNYGPQVGIVVTPLPEIKIRLNHIIVLEKEHLVIAGHIYSHYRNADGTYLSVGDHVILFPSANEQTYFLVDKAVTL